jgi:hypothetical protein
MNGQREDVRQFISLRWHPNMDRVRFITSVSSAVKLHVDAVAQKQRSFILKLDGSFWKKFCALSVVEAGHVLDVLKTAPITHIFFISRLRLLDHGPN